jgi:hypothetical protein
VSHFNPTHIADGIRSFHILGFTLLADFLRQILELSPVLFIHPDIDIVEFQPVISIIIFRFDLVNTLCVSQELFPFFLEKVNRRPPNLKIVCCFAIRLLCTPSL